MLTINNTRTQAHDKPDTVTYMQKIWRFAECSVRAHIHVVLRHFIFHSSVV